MTTQDKYAELRRALREYSLSPCSNSRVWDPAQEIFSKAVKPDDIRALLAGRDAEVVGEPSDAMCVAMVREMMEQKPGECWEDVMRRCYKAAIRSKDQP